MTYFVKHNLQIHKLALS